MKTYLALLSMVLCIPVNAEDIEVLYRNTSRLMSNLYSDRGFDAKEEQQRLKRSLTVYEGFKEREVAVPSAFYKLIDGLARLPVRDYTHLSKFGDKVESMLPIKRINPKRSDTRSSSLYPALAYLPNFVASLKDQNPEEEKIKYVLKKRDLAVFLLMQLQLLKRQPFSHETTSILEAVVSAGNDSQDYMLRLWTIDYLGGLASQDHYQKVKGEKWMKQVLTTVSTWQESIVQSKDSRHLRVIQRFNRAYPHSVGGISPVLKAITAKQLKDITKQDTFALWRIEMSGRNASHYLRSVTKMLVGPDPYKAHRSFPRLVAILFKDSNSFVATLDNETIDLILKHFDGLDLDRQVLLLHVLLFAKDRRKGLAALGEVSSKLLPRLSHSGFLPWNDKKHTRNSIGGLDIVALCLDPDKTDKSLYFKEFLEKPFPGKIEEVRGKSPPQMFYYNLRVAVHGLHLLGEPIESVVQGMFAPKLTSSMGIMRPVLAFGMLEPFSGEPPVNDMRYLLSYPRSKFSKSNLNGLLSLDQRPNPTALGQLWLLQNKAKPLYSNELLSSVKRLIASNTRNIPLYLLMDLEANISGKLSPGTLKKVASLRHDSWTMEHDVLLKTMPNHPLLKKVLEHFLADKDRAYNKVLTWALRMHLDGSAELPFPEKAFGEFVQRPSVPVLLTIARLDGRLLSYFDKIRSPFHFAGTYKIDIRARGLYFDLLDRLILLKRKKTLRPLIPQKRNR